MMLLLNCLAVLNHPQDRSAWAALATGLLMSLGLLSSALVQKMAYAESPDRAMQVIQKYCAGCHSDSQPDGDVSLTSLEKIVSAKLIDKNLVVPGRADESLLYRLMSGRSEPKMPPDENPQPTASDIESVRLWIESGASTTLRPKPSTVTHSVGSAAGLVSSAMLLPDRRLLLGRFGRIDVSQLDDQSNPQQTGLSLDGLAGKVVSMRLSADSKWLVVGSGQVGQAGEIALVDLATLKIAQKFQGHNDVVYCAAVSPEGRWLASGSYDRKVLLWDVQSGQMVAQLNGHNGAIYDLDFHPSQPILATASADQTVKLWSLPSGARLDTLGQPEGEMRCVRFSTDGKMLYAGGADKQIRQWLVDPSATSGSPMVHARFAHEREVLRVELVPGNQLLSAAADGSVKVWDTVDLLPLGQVARSRSVPVALAVIGDSAVGVVDLRGDLVRLDFDAIRHEQASTGLSSDGLSKSGATKDSSSLSAAQKQTSQLSAPESPLQKISEHEPNDALVNAQEITLPVEISGVVQADVPASALSEQEASATQAVDVDLFRFQARAGEAWLIELFAAVEGSKLDSLVDILDSNGQPVLQSRLQALRESYFTFRGKDSSTSDDFRLHKWEEMELNQYLYSSGEVTRLWLYPRGPDSGFKVYPGSGARYTYFGTTPVSHALGEPAYVVRPLADNEPPLPNGLPVFPIYYENDDDPLRERGADSRLTFRVPADGHYVLRLRDARGFQSAQHRYRLVIRKPLPDYQLSFGKLELSVAKGSGQEWSVQVKRLDGMKEAIAVHLHGLPEAFQATNPLIIQADQLAALGTVYLPEGAEISEQPIEVKLTAQSLPIDGSEPIVKQLDQVLKLTVNDQVKPHISLHARHEDTGPLDELTVRPGETIVAVLKVDRRGLEGGISFGREDSGRNLPHGCFVDNIGLNGLLIVPDQSSREVFITASPITAPGRYQFHFRTETPGNPTSKPIWIQVIR